MRTASQGSYDGVHRAALLDHHAASVLSIKEIRAMVEELIEAHGDAIPKGVRTATTPPAQVKRYA